MMGELNEDERIELEALRHLAVLTVQPGDALVVQVRERLAMEEVRHWRDMLDRLPESLGLPEGTRCILLNADATLGVIRKAAA